MNFNQAIKILFYIIGLAVTLPALATTTYTYTDSSGFGVGTAYSGTFSVDSPLADGSYSFLSSASQPAGFTENFFTTPFVDGRGVTRTPSLALFDITIKNGVVEKWDIRASTLFTTKRCIRAVKGVCVNAVYYDNATLIYHDTNVPYLPGGGMAYQASIPSGDYQTYYNYGFAYQEALTGANSGIGVWSITTTSGITPVSPIVNTTSLPSTTVGTTYTANVVSTIPASDSKTVTVTGLPTGLSFDATTNTISGSATVIGSFNVSITVVDTTTNLSTSNSLVLTVNDTPVVFAPANFADATTNAPYAATFNTATGGYGSFTYTATGLPTGVTFAVSMIGVPTITGTPTVAGQYNVTLTAKDSVGVSASTVVTLNVIDPVVVVPTACSGTNAVISAYVPRNPGFITVNGGLNLLDHLWTNNLNAGNTTFNGGLVNWYSTGAIVSWTGIADPNGCILDHLTVSPRVAISTNSLPIGSVVGTTYTAAVNVQDGVAPYTTTVSGLPAGLSFDGSNIVGTPTVAGTFTITISTADSLGITAVSAPLALTVSAPPPPALATPSITLPTTGTVGVLYSGSATVTGGVAPFTWTASGLPTGVSISTAGVISGTPTTAATFATPIITVTDTANQTVSVTGNNIIISAAPVVQPPVTPPSTVATCTAPAGAKTGLNTTGKITSISGNNITFSKTNKTTGVVTVTTVTVPACAVITWNGGATAFAVGQGFEWKGYSSTATGNVAQSVTIG